MKMCILNVSFKNKIKNMERYGKVSRSTKFQVWSDQRKKDAFIPQMH